MKVYFTTLTWVQRRVLSLEKQLEGGRGPLWMQGCYQCPPPGSPSVQTWHSHMLQDVGSVAISKNAPVPGPHLATLPWWRALVKINVMNRAFSAIAQVDTGIPAEIIIP